ncbi:MAG: methyltransferase [Myxococcaceae bacterium]|nr:methyltransferase [Myxococcaceae bacterium]
MIGYDEFVRRLRGESDAIEPASADVTAVPSKTRGFAQGKVKADARQKVATRVGTTFAQDLMAASGFGVPTEIPLSQVILGVGVALSHLPSTVRYFKSKGEGQPHVILLEFAAVGSSELLKGAKSLFPSEYQFNLVEDALDRFAQEVLRGFAKPRAPEVPGAKHVQETLCVFAVRDARVKGNGNNNHLVHFSTVTAEPDEALESFVIRQECVDWDVPRSGEYMRRVYERAFKKIDGSAWKDAFARQPEREKLREVAKACLAPSPKKEEIHDRVVKLLSEIASTYDPQTASLGQKIQCTELPIDHDIGSPARSEIGDRAGLPVAVPGIAVRREDTSLLGYVIYCLGNETEAADLRERLGSHNRFHNVLVIYPATDCVQVELWQGRQRMEGKLTKSGAHYKNEGRVISFLSRFFVISRSEIADPKELAEELAYRARYLQQLALRQVEELSELKALYESFKQHLVHSQTPKEFADAYAQTLTYGLLAARWISKDEFLRAGVRFTRNNARGHFPRTSPFLRALFDKVLDAGFDYKQVWLLDDVADLLNRVDIDVVFSGAAVGRAHDGNVLTAGRESVVEVPDPVIHFYEPFLAAFDKKLKSKRGVFYTPQAVVKYIVRQAHELLQTHPFLLADGLADVTAWQGEGVGERVRVTSESVGSAGENEFVRILDPAAGTGTFLFACVDVIEETVKRRLCAEFLVDDWEDIRVLRGWREYVGRHLLPRLFGFELMVAPYAIAHMRLAAKLKETGYVLGENDRLNVLLTNSLESSVEVSEGRADLLGTLASEAQVVNSIKESQRFTVVLGNPPYSLHSQNMNDESRAIVNPYRSVGGVPIKEKGALQFEKIIQDDYVKFFRVAEISVLTAGVGVLGFVANHGFLDNQTLRGMRYSLLSSFDYIRCVNLHGSNAKSAVVPEGVEDQNVFDIKQGVAIFLGARRGPADDSANDQPPDEEVLQDHLGTDDGSAGVVDPPRTVTLAHDVGYSELWGTREEKYCALGGAPSLAVRRFAPAAPSYLFVPTLTANEAEYDRGWKVSDIFPVGSMGVVTARDNVAVSFDAETLVKPPVISIFPPPGGSTARSPA